MAKSETPMMKQYNEIKSKYPETVLLFRMGDFFETFDTDAVITAKVCGITLTKRNNGAAGDMALAGFPHHQLDAYLPKLVRGGYRVAVCEQLEDPKQAKGIVKRGVVEVVTPGTAIYDKLLDSQANNYLASIYISNDLTKNKSVNYTDLKVGISFVDISTGEFKVTEVNVNELIDVLISFAPSEIIISKSDIKSLESYIEKLPNKPSISKIEDWIFEFDFALERIIRTYKVNSLKGFGIENLKAGIVSVGAILYYIEERGQINLSHIKSPSYYNTQQYMILDYSTRRNLEILYSNSDNQKFSLYNVLDKTKTPMGSRLLKHWISKPLLDLEAINQRLNSVETLLSEYDIRQYLINLLSKVNDLERLVAKLGSMRVIPRDLIAIKSSLQIISELKTVKLDNEKLTNIFEKLDELADLTNHLELALNDNGSNQIGAGQVFYRGFNQELDTYVEAKYSGKDWIKEFQETEKVRSGLSSLKVSFNGVFGYYIEISKVQAKSAPAYYERRQTLTNAERYTTPELKEIESKIFSAEAKIQEIESKLFEDIKGEVCKYITQIQNNAMLIAELDCLISFAEVSNSNNYKRPQITIDKKIEIKNGRHPVVEKNLKIGQNFIANNTYLDNESEFIHILTGPNMSGKSCYLRQVGLITLLTHIGCYVPADEAVVGLTDRIFTRVGASDNLSAGESTFLVEMQEAANILNNATSRSLVLLDEVGRGTATYDGISIAWAIIEYIYEKLVSKTIFATHYHELNELEQIFDKVKNYRVDVIEQDGSIYFTHKVVSGYSDHSFGIQVAKMAGLPLELTLRAKDILRNLESNDAQEQVNFESKHTKKSKPNMSKIQKNQDNTLTNQMSMFTFVDDEIRLKLKDINLNELTPLQALQKLEDLKKLL